MPNGKPFEFFGIKSEPAKETTENLLKIALNNQAKKNPLFI